MKHTIFFENFNDIYNEHSSGNPDILDTESDLIPEIFRGFTYPISSWPIIISKKMKKELEEASTTIPRLLQKIPSLYFDNNSKDIADFYFNGNEALVQFSLMCQNKNVEVSSRLDLTYTKNGFKVLEVNMGSSIGGMEFQNFEPLIKTMHPILSENKEKFHSKKTQSIYIQFLIDKIEEYVASNDTEFGIFIVNDTNGSEAAKNMVKVFFDQLLQKEVSKRNKKGNTYVDSINRLKLINNDLQYQGNKIHAVLILDYALNNITPDLFRALIMNKVYFPDHLGTAFMRDKRNLALLRNLATSGKFNENDAQIIRKYIPWTELIEDKRVFYKEEAYLIPELLIEKKDNFVIKIADGLQGKDVFIGKFCSKEQWENVLEKARKEKNYIAQEFSESIDLLVPNSTENWKSHKLVWGAFGFGNTYAGTWVRMSANQKDGGVINSATGAVEGIVYEACELSE